jgi:hypothetical protein
VITFGRLKRASFAHSTIYAALLISWAAGWHTGQLIFGYGHGIGWFVMVGLTLAALRRRVVPLYVAVCVAIIGAVGPFVGSASFLYRERQVRA